MELNREQIIKALECCHLKSEDCISCPFVLLGENCANLEKDTIALIKELTEENEELKSDLKYVEEEYDRVYEQAEADIRGNIADGGTSCHWCIAGHRAEAVQKMQKKLEERIDQTIQVFDFQISECNAVRQALRGVKNDINQIAKEVLED